ncbi:lactate utilization protein [Sporomusa malonica]|uniref:Uncharacterized ACR, YkgG family COG1556 n=1 Tax=Sporomusa malonica TaxID=112901 RepID=A0A1W2BB31_9FIRM|nr:lactate utilization protein [Sporomusa malonica]SMC70207.1 Uncharacterised ACR, YkgG family COG1556 [Sporomusa malonica]
MDKLIEKLGSINIQAYIANDSDEARHLALGLIPQGATVAMGNSLTLREVGIFDAIVNGSYKVINQFEPGISAAENLKRRKAGMLADVYFTSANALTLDGELVNIDGKGNRVAAMMFGPDKVIIVVGENKIVKDQEEAWQRLKEKVAPELTKKLGRSTPCAKTGECSNCNSPERVCRCYTVINGQMPADKDRIHVIIVREQLGI